MKQNIRSVLIILLVITIARSQQAALHKVLLKQPSALCLDGSPGAYYFLKGSSPDKFVLYFQGGGWCGSRDLANTIHDCYTRGKGDLGSSKNYPATVSFTSGFISNNEKNQFKDHTKVFLKYCDGSGHQGYKAAPVDYQGSKVYFRGSNITMSVMEEIQKTEGLFSKATQIIVAGQSAGGLAAMVWVDYVRSKAKTNNVFGIIDSGIFLDAADFKTHEHLFVLRIMNIFKIADVESSPPVPDCIKANPNSHYKCMFAEQLHKYVKSPIFMVQSLYDSYSIPSILGIACVNGTGSLKTCTKQETAYIEQYHKNLTNLLNSITSHPQNGAWGISCPHHTFTAGSNVYNSDFEVPMSSKYTIQESVREWVKQEKVSYKHIDQVEWPNNKPCAGATLAMEQ